MKRKIMEKKGEEKNMKENKLHWYVLIAIALFVGILIGALATTQLSTTGEAKGGVGGGDSRPQCSDGRDNDNDGLCDFSNIYKRGTLVCARDPDCYSMDDLTEGVSTNSTTEICNGEDDDLDGQIDEAVCPALTYYCDNDWDNYKSLAISGTCSTFNCVNVYCQTTPGNDRDDFSKTVFPGAIEICNNIDDDQDNIIDEDCTDNPCQELFPGTNVIGADRVNVVFAPLNFNTAEGLATYLDKIKRAVDYSSEYPEVGLMEMSVYKDNKTKFNFWYIPKSFTVSNPSSTFHYPSQMYCTDLGGYRTFALIGNASYTSNANRGTSSSTSIYQMTYGFRHEFQHQFPGLSDEYVNESKPDIPFQPNCAADQATAQSWWGDLVGTTADGQVTGYYSGCSYASDNIRPCSISIMSSVGTTILCTVHQRQINAVLANYTGTVPSAAPSNVLEFDIGFRTPGDISTAYIIDTTTKTTNDIIKINSENANKYAVELKYGNQTLMSEPIITEDIVFYDDFDPETKEVIDGGVTIIPRSSTKVRIRLPPNTAYNHATKLINVSGLQHSIETRILKIGGGLN